jgi:hypothetical protein
MAKEQKDNVVQLTTSVCCVEKCGKKGDRLNFCPEHYVWFKEGLVNRKGQRPLDFDKKFQAWSMRTGKKAA